ncbi:glycosyltransferase family 2 protein [Nafulsella turpanensis]|uniref:glycosyltransferase family 2 protein n=1 Tax=Nafulsella turpanensis TaxID=1265690 RepID=UPI0003496AD9|nr:glycosyltransferase family 2 protein [Nafulsella turpanensis]
MMSPESHSLPLVSIITVNFNQPEVTEELLASLSNITYPNTEILVVDNGCDRGCSYLKQQFPEVQFLESKQNLGFAGGNNLAIQKASGEYILLLNNDTEVEPSFLEPMIALFREVPRLGIVSPLLIYHGTNLVQYAGARAINYFTGRGSKVGHKEKVREAFFKSYPTELGHGAAMLFPKKLIHEIGLLPESYFLYYEEHDWCEACKRAGYQVYFQGASRVFHKESVSVGKANPLKTYYLNRNRLLFIRRNATGIQKYIALAFYLLMAFPKNLLFYSIKGQKKHREALVKALGWNFPAFSFLGNKELKLERNERY